MTTMMLSVGVPMLSGGDEVGRTQLGNNNAYCQDNEISWTPWELDADQRDFLEFTRRLIRVWRDHPVLRRRKFFQGRRIRGADVTDIAWIDPSGREMTDETWNSPDVRCLGVRLNGDAIDEVNERGERIVGDTLVILLNAGEDAVPFSLPATGPTERWEAIVDTADPWAPVRWLMAKDRFRLQSAIDDRPAAGVPRARRPAGVRLGPDGRVLRSGRTRRTTESASGSSSCSRAKDRSGSAWRVLTSVCGGGWSSRTCCRRWTTAGSRSRGPLASG